MILLEAFPVGTTTYLSWKWDRCLVLKSWWWTCSLSHVGVFDSNLYHCITFLTFFVLTERVYTSSFSRFPQLGFQFMNLGSQYFSPLANISRRELFLIILRWLIITWPVGLYTNGKFAQVQSGGLDFKSSTLSYCITFV